MKQIIHWLLPFLFSGIGLLIVPSIIKWFKHPSIQLYGELGPHGSSGNNMGGVQCSWKVNLGLRNEKHKISNIKFNIIGLANPNNGSSNIVTEFVTGLEPYAHDIVTLLLYNNVAEKDFKQTRQSPDEYRNNSPTVDLEISFRNEAGRKFNNYYSIAIKDERVSIHCFKAKKEIAVVEGRG
jgi:hypothetical protein